MHSSPTLLTTHQAAEALREARNIFEDRPTWAGFFRRVFSSGGLLDQRFPDYEARRAFSRTPQYREIVEMLTALRDGRDLPQATVTRMITVRLPSELHDALRRRAAADRKSMNRFCVDTLLDAVTEPPAEAAFTGASTPAQQ